MTATIKLLPGETMAAYRARKRLDVEAAAMLTIVRSNPGIRSKDAIAAMTGFTPERVEVILRALNRNETTHKVRVDFGTARAKSGPWAGKRVTGWFPQDVAAYQGVMEQADKHSMLVEAGVRDSRRARRLYALGLNTVQAAKVVAEIEARLKVPVDKLTAQEAVEFDRLATKQAIDVIRNGN